MNVNELKAITNRKGYGVTSTLGKGIKSAIGSKVGDKGETSDVESASILESLRSERVQVNYSGKVRVRLKFFRRRLADYSRANSEKAAIDCLAYAGLISGDSETEIWLEDEGQFKVETNEEERIELTLEYEAVNTDELWVPAKHHGGR